jgi:hypothetical protein
MKKTKTIIDKILKNTDKEVLDIDVDKEVYVPNVRKNLRRGPRDGSGPNVNCSLKK